MTGQEDAREPVRTDLRAGSLLISSPALGDPNFARTLVLLLDADEQGSLGVVLNRPSDVRLDGLLDQWGPLVSEPSVLFRGGPVEPEGALGVAVLLEGAPQPQGWRPLFGRAGLVDLDEAFGGDFVGVRIYAGYAGWGSGQLQQEVAEGAWYVVPARAEDLVAADPEELWLRVLRRQVEPLSLLVTMPSDPGLN